MSLHRRLGGERVCSLWLCLTEVSLSVQGRDAICQGTDGLPGPTAGGPGCVCMCAAVSV